MRRCPSSPAARPFVVAANFIEAAVPLELHLSRGRRAAGADARTTPVLVLVGGSTVMVWTPHGCTNNPGLPGMYWAAAGHGPGVRRYSVRTALGAALNPFFDWLADAEEVGGFSTTQLRSADESGLASIIQSTVCLHI